MILYCPECDRRWDTDWHEACPTHEDEREAPEAFGARHGVAFHDQAEAA